VFDQGVDKGSVFHPIATWGVGRDPRKNVVLDLINDDRVVVKRGVPRLLQDSVL
jgi:hypothetical protein